MEIMAEGKGLMIEKEGFESRMDEEREQSRGHSKMKHTERLKNLTE